MTDPERNKLEQEIKEAWQSLKSRWSQLQPEDQGVVVLFVAGGLMILLAVTIYLLRILL